MKGKVRETGNNEIHTELSGYEGLFAAMVESALEDYCKEYPRITKDVVSLKYLFSDYYKKCGEIDVKHDNAKFFFDSPNSLFNKYFNLNKEYLIRHYKEKHGKDKRRFNQKH